MASTSLRITRFLRVFKQKRLMLATGDWWLHLDNIPMHNAAVVNNWMGASQFKIIQHPLYEPNLA
jgi:hypothetical protein